MDREQSLDVLKQRVFDVFPKSPPPGFDHLIEHQCPECEQLRDTFHDHEWWKIDSDTIFANYDKLPLFQAEAYRYYLPAFIRVALSNFSDDNLVLEFFLYSWMSSGEPRSIAYHAERRAVFSKDQLSLIEEIFRMVAGDPGMSVYHKNAAKVLRSLDETG